MKIYSPFRIIGIWIPIVIVVDLVTIPILFNTTAGGEQRPLTFLVESFKIAAYGIMLLSIVGFAFFYKNWSKLYWVFSLFFLLIGTFYIFRSNGKTIPYGFDEATYQINGSTLKCKTEFYGQDSEAIRKIRSISFWKDNKKDSVWVTYSENGKVLEEKRYKNDTLVSR
jgi:hypothetical protein